MTVTKIIILIKIKRRFITIRKILIKKVCVLALAAEKRTRDKLILKI